MGTETSAYEKVVTFLLEANQALNSGRTWKQLGAAEASDMNA
jgi:hypothetical protein